MNRTFLIVLATILSHVCFVAWIPSSVSAQRRGIPNRRAQAANTADISAEAVNNAIEKAVRFIRDQQQKGRGDWRGFRYEGDVTALATLALLNAGVPADDPQIVKAIEHLRTSVDRRFTYVVSLRTMVLATADPKGRLYKRDIARDVEWLVNAQVVRGVKTGAWAYEASGSGSGDASNSQFALLALHEASKVGVRVPEKTWRNAAEYWTNNHIRTGGFGYNPASGRATGSMTCAGISSWVIIRENLAESDDLIKNGRVNCCAATDKSDDFVEDGAKWLGENFTVKANPAGPRDASAATALYYMYALERAGRLSGKRFFGAFDWYREGVAHFLRPNYQQLDGSWKGSRPQFGEGQPVIATSFALLFLSKGKRPIVIGKLEHGVGRDWDHHPKGVHQLTRQIEKQWNKKLNWQTVKSDATVSDLLEAPVLFISGRDNLDMTEKQKSNLKKYVERGGFIFAEACQGDGCGADAVFDRKFRLLMAELFPESPLEALPVNHPVWNSHFRIQPKSSRPLLGLQACCRTSVIYCPRNLTCFWQVDRPELLDKLNKQQKAEAIYCSETGVNVVTYATGRQLRDKLDTPKIEEDQLVSVLEGRMMEFPKLSHNGGADEAPNAWRNVLTEARETGLRIGIEKKLVPIDAKKMADYPMLFMHGRAGMVLSKDERDAIKEYVSNGNILLVDSVCSAQAFTDSFRKEMGFTFPDNPLKDIPPDHPIWTDEKYGFAIKAVTLRSPDPNVQGGFRERKTHPLLQGIEIDGRLAILFSPYDLSCAMENSTVSQCKGYSRQDASIIARKIILYRLRSD